MIGAVSSSPRVHVSPAHDGLAEAVRAGGGELVDALDGADVLVWSTPRPGGFPELPGSVRWVQLPLAGIEAWVDGGVLRPGPTWTSAAGAYAATVAEHAVAMLLAGVRGLPRAVRQTSWDPAAVGPPIGTLAGATVGILGAGGIGRAMIPALRGLGAEVLAVTRSGRPVDGAVRTLDAAHAGEVWDAADHVVVAAPATSSTRHLVGADELARLGTGGWLVNIARGSLVDTDALVTALRDGTIGGAALDVTDPEPLPDDHPLWTLPTALVTPHVANPSHHAAAALADRVRDNVSRWAAGEELLGVVDLDAGY
ncbi:D-isomer specific 2-hydroxyacid dehydrogenase family protein [Rhodococcus aerolatus]